MAIRTIIFRGKRTDNGEWVEGRLLADDVIALCGQEFRVLLPENCFCADEDFVVCIVHPETVGQYTGLTDRNGKRIFEGDILSERPSMNSVAFVGKVVFNEDAAAFQIVFDTGRAFVLGTYSRSYSVIGNIHDNPELMKVVVSKMETTTQLKGEKT